MIATKNADVTNTVYDMLRACRGYGEKSEAFIQGFYVAVGQKAIERNNIVINYCSFKQPEMNAERTDVYFDAELSVSWLNNDGKPFMHGGLIWSDSMKTWTYNT